MAPAALDLHSLAVLINYERACGLNSDVRYKHAKLRETLTSSGGKFRTVAFPDDMDLWPGLPASQPKSGFLFDIAESSPASEHDLPSNMISSQSEGSLAGIGAEELETIFWQSRGHDGCYFSISIFQALADLYSPSQALRIRLHNGTEFMTTLSARTIQEFILQAPKHTTLSIIMSKRPAAGPKNSVQTQFLYTGESSEMVHSTWEFINPNESGAVQSVMLDLASMQFGSAGRGKGGEFFVLDEAKKWRGFAKNIAQSCEDVKVSQRIRKSDNAEREDWFGKVALRVRERWDARETNHWCGLCGKPDATKRCGRCSQEYYCSEAHSQRAWKHWHKKWCAPKDTE